MNVLLISDTRLENKVKKVKLNRKF